MCGIFGYFDRLGFQMPLSTLKKMGEVIAYRGPDNQGIYAGSSVALGNQRLSIIDLHGGNQPFTSDDGRIVVVQNGEIFNHVELAKEVVRRGNPCRTNSDTEVLLRLYELDGIKFLERLNGMFAIAIYDAHNEALYLIRDRIGVKPLYFYDDGGRFIFSSEIKSILVSGIRAPDTNEEALHHYFSFNYVPPPLTIYSGITHLMPGTYIRVDRKGAVTTRWWNLANIDPILRRSEDSWIEEFNEILDDAVRIRLRSDVPFGAFLSGGVDSSTIVGLMSKHVEGPISTFCIGFEDPLFDESCYAKQAADRFSTNHTLKVVDADMLDLWPMAIFHCDQPHGDLSFLPTYQVSKLAATKLKVVLTGDGGDELFAGYEKYQNFFSDPKSHCGKEVDFQRKYFDSISLFSHENKLCLYKPEMARRMREINSFDLVRPYFQEVGHQDRINQALYVDMQLLLSGNNLVKPDRMGMATSIEARTPFLDYRMMEFAFKVPGHLKLKDGHTKYIYKKAVRNLIGDDLAYRKKQMFTVPVGDWFRGNKAGYCRNNMPDRFFDLAYLAKLCDEHIEGRMNRTRELRALIAVKHWQSLQKK